ncbi:MAG: alpha/beta fold hydrolase [Pseudomonadota bacterium]
MADRRQITLFCLPFAGGSSYSYRDLQRHTDAGLRVEALELPGRGRRFPEPLLTSLHDMADDVFGQIRDRLNGAYAIYGHSLGASIGYLLVKRIIRERCPLPLHLFVSGREGPSVQGKEKDRHLLPRAEFVEILKRFEGTTKEVIENQELMELFEPVLRADFQALDTYTYEKSERFDVPITVMQGSDESLMRADALRWQDETTKEISFLEFNGGHFFIFQHAAKIGAVFSRGVMIPSDTAV